MTDIRITLDKHNPAQKAVEGFFNDPPTHADGKRVIVGSSPTGDFIGHSGDVAWSYDDTWSFDTPEYGYLVWVESEGDYYRFEGSWELYFETEDLNTEDISFESVNDRLTITSVNGTQKFEVIAPFKEEFEVGDWEALSERYKIDFNHGFGQPVKSEVKSGDKKVSIETITISEDIERIIVPADPDLRFAGSIIITK